MTADKKLGELHCKLMALLKPEYRDGSVRFSRHELSEEIIRLRRSGDKRTQRLIDEFERRITE